MERDLSLNALLRPHEAYDFFQDLHEVGPLFSKEASHYDPIMSWLLAEASMLAYARDEALVRDAWSRLDANELHFFDAKGAQGYIAVRHDAAVLVFRGTEPDDLHDILADMKFMLVPHKKSGLVHYGFTQAINAIWDDLHPVLEAVKPRPVWIAGHSLGAALSLLAGTLVEHAQAVYTYGAPRIGSRGFRDRYDCPVYRVANNNDIVTMIPPPLLYRHIGDHWFIDHQGWVRPGESTSSHERMESRFLGHIDHANKVFRLWRRRKFLDAIPNSNVTDHAPVNYVRPLRMAIGRVSYRVARLLEQTEELSPDEHAQLIRGLTTQPGDLASETPPPPEAPPA